MTSTYVSMMATYTICGVDAVSLAAIPDLMVVLSETLVIFAVVCLTLQMFRVASLAVVLVE